MADEKQAMQADGHDGVGADVANESNPPSAGRPEMGENVGQSGGGAYPNPRQAKSKGAFHGGQSEAGYFGDGQLGSNKVGKNDNSVNEED